jgi:MFS family permease
MFAPLGEMYGRRLVAIITLAAFAIFQLQGCLARNNIYALLSCRLLTGMFGSSRTCASLDWDAPVSHPFTALVNAPAQISDIWNARELGLASAIYSVMPFLGPSMLKPVFVVLN